ncbi:spore coat protein U domain-containing protein [Escherichia coli]|nr:spore coat protein U domain-containing protein [Escherichia coli]ELW7705914.1 spore coat protein U domain-containing protein [Escherichia coli]
MKKLTLITTLMASAMSFSSHAATTSATVNITGKIVPASCSITANANGGTIDFGNILTSELTSGKKTLTKEDSLSVSCDKATTAAIKISGGNGATSAAFATNKEYASFIIGLTQVSPTGGTATDTLMVSKASTIDLSDIAAASFTKGFAASQAFPASGNYFTVADSSDQIGTFQTLTVNYKVYASIDSEKAKAAASAGADTFDGQAIFELNYL